MDNNILSYFFNAERKQDLARVAAELDLAVVEEVHEEALRYKTRGAEYRAWQKGARLPIRKIGVGSDESAVLASLRRGSAGLKDLGELASIAFATSNPSLVLVMNDKNGIWIALRELFSPAERVIRWSTFLRRAHDSVTLSAECVQDLAGVSQLAHAPPTWWQDWIATLKSE